MIRHIVFFSFKTNVSDQRRELFATELRALKYSISQVKELDVAFDVGRKGNSYDLVLDSQFDSMEDVDTYQGHPAHVMVLGSVASLCEKTAKVDFEIADKKQ